jgi:hypothetical protein
MRPGSAAWIARRCATGFIDSTRPVPDGLRDAWASGPTPRLSAAQKAQLADIIEAGPDREIDGVVRWRRIDLKRVIVARFGVDYHERPTRNAAEGARLPAYERASASSWPEHRDDRGFQKNFSRTLNAHLADLPPTSVNPNNRWYQPNFCVPVRVVNRRTVVTASFCNAAKTSSNKRKSIYSPRVPRRIACCSFYGARISDPV